MSRADRWWRQGRGGSSRPAQRALASRARRERFTGAELDQVADTSLEAGRAWGRREGESDLFRALAQDFVLREDAIPDDLIALAAYIGGKTIAGQLDTFLRVERARQEDPDTMRRLAEAIELPGEEGKQALEAIAREMGVFPDGQPDDLLDVAEAAGVTPMPEVDAEQLVDELEAWLRGRDGDG